MKKKLVTVKAERVEKYFNILGEECEDETGAELSSKRYLLRNALMRVDVVTDVEASSFVATSILELEKKGVIRIYWDKMKW